MPAGRKPAPPTTPPSRQPKTSPDRVASDLKKLDSALRKALAKQGITPTSPGYDAARRNQNNALVAYAMKQAAAKVKPSGSTGGRVGPPKPTPRTRRGD